MFDNYFAPIHLLIILMISLPVLLLVGVPFWRIFRKAGFSPPFSLLMPIPLVDLVMIYVLAFAPWRPTQN
jgi:hypothetical protein